MLHKVFQVEDRQLDVFWHLGEVCAKKSKAKLGQSSLECFMQMLEANTDQSEESIPWSPLKIGCSRTAHSISWIPSASVPWCEGSDSQQMIAASSALCLHKEAYPCNGNAEFALLPSVSQLLVPLFLNLLIITGSCRAAGAGWSWDLKQVPAVLGAVSEKEQRTVRCWEEENTARPSQILALRKLRDHQELCKAETSMWEASSDSVISPCDNLQNNPCCVHVIWVRIPPKVLLQMRTLVLPHLPLFTFKAALSDCLCSKMLAGCWLCVIYLLWFGVRMFWRSALQSLCHVC